VGDSAEATVPEGRETCACPDAACHRRAACPQPPGEVRIALPEQARRPRLAYPRLRVARCSGAAPTEGIDEHRVEGATLITPSRRPAAG
jgi:hypothetical protein